MNRNHSFRRRTLPRTLSRKRGAVLIAVLVALGLLIVMISVTLQGALRSRREVRNQLILTQTNWLCDAGLQRAIRAVRKNAAYDGELWSPQLSEQNIFGASVHISVETRSQSKHIRVVAEIAIRNSEHQRMRRSVERTIASETTSADSEPSSPTSILLAGFESPREPSVNAWFHLQISPSSQSHDTQRDSIAPASYSDRIPFQKHN